MIFCSIFHTLNSNIDNENIIIMKIPEILKCMFFQKKKSVVFLKMDIYFLSIFKIWQTLFVFKKHTFCVLPENALKTKKIIFICY
jgi:hypothetical protein